MKADTTTLVWDGFEGWTIDDAIAAEAEGWNIWDCDLSVCGRFQICRYDDDDKFADDSACHGLIARMVAAGSVLHRRAALFIWKYNTLEYASIFPR